MRILLPVKCVLRKKANLYRKIRHPVLTTFTLLRHDELISNTSIEMRLERLFFEKKTHESVGFFCVSPFYVTPSRNVNRSFSQHLTILENEQHNSRICRSSFYYEQTLQICTKIFKQFYLFIADKSFGLTKLFKDTTMEMGNILKLTVRLNWG